MNSARSFSALVSQGDDDDDDGDDDGGDDDHDSCW